MQAKQLHEKRYGEFPAVAELELDRRKPGLVRGPGATCGVGPGEHVFGDAHAIGALEEHAGSLVRVRLAIELVVDGVLEGLHEAIILDGEGEIARVGRVEPLQCDACVRARVPQMKALNLSYSRLIETLSSSQILMAIKNN